MWILCLTTFLVFLTFISAIIFDTTILWILSFSGLGLLLLYGIVKQAVKSALQEYDREKELPSGQKQH